MLTGAGSGTAYASWTTNPSPYTGSAAQESARACTAELARMTGTTTGARVAISERRGNYAFLTVATPTSTSAQCFFDTNTPGKPVAVSGQQLGSPGQPPQVAPERVSVGAIGAQDTPEGKVQFFHGQAGTRVRKVTITLNGWQPVTATVNNGLLTAWWPARLANHDGWSVASCAITLDDGTHHNQESCTDVPIRH